MLRRLLYYASYRLKRYAEHDGGGVDVFELMFIQSEHFKLLKLLYTHLIQADKLSVLILCYIL